MANFHLASRTRKVLYLKSLSTLTAADDKDFVTIPWQSAKLVGGIMSVQVAGTTSGATGIMLERHRDEDGGNNMLSAAQEIENDATTLSTVFDRSVIVATGPEEVIQGDQIGLNIDEVPTAASNLSVALIFDIIKE